MSQVQLLRVHLIHQSFGDYVGGLVEGLVDQQRVVVNGDEWSEGESLAVDLRVTTVRHSAAPPLELKTSLAEHQTVRVPRFRDPRAPLKAAAVVRRLVAEPCDVIHWQPSGSPWVDLAFSLHMDRCPTVVTVHDMRPHPGDRGGVLPGQSQAIHRVARKADRVIVHAPHIRQQGIEVGIEAERISVLPHGELASRYVSPDRLPLPPATEPTVLFFGRAEGYKGLDVLAAAMPLVVQKVPEAKLIVAGSGYVLDRVFPPNSVLPTWAEVERGVVGSEKVVELFGRAALVGLPYREASQSGVAALAAGFGRPVVASSVAGLRDIVEDGVTGVLVAPESPQALADAVIELLESKSEQARLSEGAYQAAGGRLSWTKIAADSLDVYHQAVRSFGGGRSE